MAVSFDLVVEGGFYDLLDLGTIMVVLMGGFGV